MISFLFKSRTFKDLKKDLLVYSQLAKKANEEKNENVKGLVELDMLNLSQIISLKIKKNKDDDNFTKDFFQYCSENYSDNENLGIPLTKDIFRLNLDYIDTLLGYLTKVNETFLFQKDDVFEKGNPLKSFKEKAHLMSSFYNMFEIRRKSRMLPKIDLIMSLNEEDYEILLEKKLFTKKEIKRFLRKLNKNFTNFKEDIFKEKNTEEFYNDILLELIETQYFIKSKEDFYSKSRDTFLFTELDSYFLSSYLEFSIMKTLIT